MVYFVSHCGVTNAVYYASHFSSAFPPLAALGPRRQPPVTLDLRTGKVPVPGLPFWEMESSRPPVREEPFTSVARVQYGPATDDWAGLFFSPAALTRNFFIAVFPSDVYDVRAPFQRASAFIRPQDGWRVPPTSRWYVFFGCPFCGEYHRKYGISAVGPAGDGPTPYLVRPTEFSECPTCLGDQRKRKATAPGLRLGAC